jgi:hypothetical protein
MSKFPLYSRLNKNYPKKDLTGKEKEEFLERLKDIDSTGKNLIYALIQFYYINNESEKIFQNLPYGGISEPTTEKNKQNVSWVLTDLPIKLRHMLLHFIRIHTQSMKEDKDLHR